MRYSKYDIDAKTKKEFDSLSEIFRGIFGLDLTFETKQRKAARFEGRKRIKNFTLGYVFLRGKDGTVWGVSGIGESPLRGALDRFLEKMSAGNGVKFNNRHGYTVLVPSFGSLAELKFLLETNGIKADADVFGKEEKELPPEQFSKMFGPVVLGKTSEMDKVTLYEALTALDEVFISFPRDGIS